MFFLGTAGEASPEEFSNYDEESYEFIFKGVGDSPFISFAF
jgi:hypothetical protein